MYIKARTLCKKQTDAHTCICRMHNDMHTDLQNNQDIMLLLVERGYLC